MGSTYSWTSSPAGFTSTASNPTVSPAETTTYTVVETITATGCSKSNSVVITVNPLPTITVTTPATCAADLLTYSVGVTVSSGTVTSSSGTVVNTSGNIWSISGITAGTDITLTVTDGNGCLKTLPVTAPDCSCPVIVPPVSGGDKSYCSGGSIPAITASVQAGETVDWYAGSTGGPVLATGLSYTPISAGTYYAEARNTTTNCKSNTRTSITVTVNALPVAAAGSPASICVGSSTTIGAAAVVGSTYSWTSSPAGFTSTASNPTVSPAETTTYTVVETITATGCSKSNSVVITVNPLPTITVTTPATCAADLLTYSVGVTVSSGTVTSSSGTVVNTSGNIWSISGITAGTDITLTVTDGNGCLKTLPVTAPDCSCPVIVPPVSGGDKSYCSGGSIPAITASVQAGETVDWYAGSTGGPVLATGLSYTPISAGTYYAEARNTTTNCKSNTRTSITVTVNALPVAAAGSPASICVGSSTTIGAAAVVGSTYSWTSSPAGFTSTASNPTVSPAETTTYTVVETITATGCSKSNSVVITVNPLPTITVTTPATCAADLLTYSVGVTVSSGTVTSSSGTVVNTSGNIWSISGITAGTDITLTVTDGNGCLKTLPVTAPDCSCPVIVPPVSGGDKSYCSGGSIPAITASVQAGETVDWYAGSTGGPVLATGLSYTPISAGTYYAEARNTTTNCKSNTRTSITVTVNALPVAAAGSPASICVGSSTTIGAAAVVGSTYSWTSSPAGFTSTASNPTVSPAETTTYTVVETITATGCSKSNSVVITVNPLPTITVTTPATCAADLLTYSVGVTVSSGTVTSSSGTVVNTSGNIWSISGITAGTDITLTVTDGNGCLKTLPVTAPDCSCPVIVPPVSGGDKSYCSGGSIPAITASVQAGETVDWYAGSTGGPVLATGLSYTPISAGTYYAEARNTTTNCKSNTRTSITVTVNALPVAAAGSPASICVGSSTTIGAAAVVGSTYSWTSSPAGFTSTASNPTVSPAETTTYTVVETITATGCSKSNSVVITVNPLPTITVTTPATCAADLLTYSVGVTVSSGTVTSSSGTVVNTSGNIWSISGITAGTDITLTVTDGNGCLKTLPVTAPDCSCPVIVPPVSGGDKSYCSGGSIPAITASVQAGETVDWYAGSTGGPVLATGLSYTPISAGTYYAEARNTTTNCKSNTRTSITVTVNALPVAAAGSPASICVGSSTTIGAAAVVGSTYSWTSSPAGFTSTASNPTVSPAETTTYTVVETITATGCSKSNSVVITVNPLPTITVTTPATCAADLLTYSVGVTVSSGTVTSSSGTVVNTSGNIWSISGITAGTDITLTVTDGNGCLKTLPVTAPDCSCPVIVPPVSGGDKSYCSGGSIPAITASVQAGETVDWYAGSTGGPVLATGLSYTPISAGTYYAEARNTTTNCKSNTRTSITVTVNALPVAAAGSPASICVGSSTTIGAAAVVGSTYSWTSSPAGFTSTASNPTVSPAETTTYTVVETITATGCSKSNSVVITVNPLPTITVTTPATCAADLLTYSVGVTVSSGTVTSSSGTVVNTSGNIWSISGITAGTDITLTVTDGNGCLKTLPVTAPDCSCPVIVPPVSGGDKSYCSGGSIPAITASVQAGETVDWYAGSTGGPVLATGLSYTPISAGTYYAEARNTTTNCKSNTRTSITVTVNALPGTGYQDWWQHV